MAHRFTDRTVKSLVNLEAFTTGIQYEEYEDTKGVIRFRIDIRQHNGQKKKYTRTNNDLQSIHIKLKIEKHESHSVPGVNAGAPEG